MTKYAVTDIGTNSVRLMLADEELRVVEKRLATTRIGEKIAETGELSEAGMERTLNALLGYAKAASDFGAPLWAFATSAVRDAKNKEEFLRRARGLGIEIEVVDGGTQGQTLLTFVERADKLLVLDAVDFGLEPGELVLRDNVPAYLTAQKIGPHQNSFSEVMGLAALRGTAPEHCALIGVQPAAMTLAAPLSTPVSESFEAAQSMALDVLRQWGIDPQLRAQPRHLSAAVLDSLVQGCV